MADTKKCSACGVVKSLSDFYRRGDRNTPRSQCKSCMEAQRAREADRHAARAAVWRAADPERARASVRISHGRSKQERDEIKSRRRRSPEEYRSMAFGSSQLVLGQSVWLFAKGKGIQGKTAFIEVTEQGVLYGR